MESRASACIQAVHEMTRAIYSILNFSEIFDCKHNHSEQGNYQDNQFNCKITVYDE